MGKFLDRLQRKPALAHKNARSGTAHLHYFPGLPADVSLGAQPRVSSALGASRAGVVAEVPEDVAGRCDSGVDGCEEPAHAKTVFGPPADFLRENYGFAVIDPNFDTYE